jgi:hypothetical protein
VEIDSNYYEKFGPSFFKSFYHHNKRWDLFVADIGLTEEQRQILSQYGEVRSYPRDKHSRWAQFSSRIASWFDVVKDDDLVFHLDVDAVVLDSFEAEVEEFLRGGYDIAGCNWKLKLTSFARNIDGIGKVLGLPPESTLLQEGCRIHAGWLLMRGSVEMCAALRWFRDHWHEYSPYATEEETALSSLVYARGLKFKAFDLVDCPSVFHRVDNSYMVPSTQPVGRYADGSSRFTHFAQCKYFLFQTSAGDSREHFMAWTDVLLRPYAELPWPAPEDVCASQR